MRSVIVMTSSMSCEMKMTLEPLDDDRAHEIEKLFDALARQKRRRLVEQHQAWPARRRAIDADFFKSAHDGEKRPLDGRKSIDPLVADRWSGQSARAPRWPDCARHAS